MQVFPTLEQAFPVLIPFLSPSDPEIEILSIEAGEGQRVARGQLLATFRTAHFIADLPAPVSGYVTGLRHRLGECVPLGTPFCLIARSSETLSLEMPLPVYDPTALVIYGGGGHGKALIDLIRMLPGWRIAGVIDDRLAPGTMVLGVPVLGSEAILDDLYRSGICMAVSAVGGIGNIDLRVNVFERLVRHGFACPPLVHPTAFVEPSAHLSPGVQLFPHAYAGSDARLGYGMILNIGASAPHDNVVGEYTNISPGTMMGGNVTIGARCLIGMNATINNGLQVGSGVRIGNGATVKRNVPDGTVVRAGRLWPE